MTVGVELDHAPVSLRTADGRALDLPVHRWFAAGGRGRAARARPRGRPGARHRLRARPSPRGARASGGVRTRDRHLRRSPRRRPASRRQRARAVGVRSGARRRAGGAARCCSTATSASVATPSRCSRRIAPAAHDRRATHRRDRAGRHDRPEWCSCAPRRRRRRALVPVDHGRPRRLATIARAVGFDIADVWDADGRRFARARSRR